MGEEKFLFSLAEVEAFRHDNETTISRPRGSNVDILTDSTTGESYAHCSLSHIGPFSNGFGTPYSFSHEDAVAMTLALSHLNTGDGSIVPQLEGLNERCKVRFTMETADAGWSEGRALEHVIDQTRREIDGEKPIPCGFIGAYSSASTTPMAIITSILKYPMMSSTETRDSMNDQDQYPLFSRTVPADNDRTGPLILYFRDVLKLTHVAVLNANEESSNAFVNGMRAAAAKYAPTMVIQQIPYDIQNGSVETVVAAVKATGIRFIYALLFGGSNQNAVMEEAYRQGIAGDGLHTWIFGEGFLLHNKVFEEGGALSKAYQGVGRLQVSGGAVGVPSYDNFLDKFSQLNNPGDMEYVRTVWPKVYTPGPPSVRRLVRPPFAEGPDFLKTSTYANTPFAYEAIVALGLAACDAVTEDLTLSAEDHYASILTTAFDGISGRVEFANMTGTRKPEGTLFEVTNFLRNEPEDGNVTFRDVSSALFQDSEWVVKSPFVFNDGTTNLPMNLAPVTEEDQIFQSTGFIAGTAVAVVAVLLAIYLLIREHKKKSNDSVWKVNKEELKFEEPPVVLGRGSFGMVLQAEYRGTQVAVKRVLPQVEEDSNDPGKPSLFPGISRESPVLDSVDALSTIEEGMSPSNQSGGMESGKNVGLKSGRMTSVGSWGGIGFGSHSTQLTSKPSWGTKVHERRAYKNLKKDFIEEMRYISRLRHPCVTTVMGAVIEKNTEPMLVMEMMDHGSLYDLLHNETMALDGDILLPILGDISQGVRFLHSADPQVIHGDLKAQNILVDSRFRAKVADFGLSQKKSLGGTGTPYWMAPELLRQESTNTAATDVFSFGVILYEVFSRKDPYEGESVKEVLQGIKDESIQKRVKAPHNMPETMKGLMADCLQEDPGARPLFMEIDNRLRRLHAEHIDVPKKANKGQVSLFDIFPRHVAEALRDGHKVEPEHKDCVTIFFSDIVGFTVISATLDPQKVANLLDRLYQRFDDLSRKHDIYKVETIGDAFMAVSNLVKDQSQDHCLRIARFAVDVIQAANETAIDQDDPSKGNVHIRVGFHSGPVVADVVGNRNPRYCLFGDAVNTASRMESNSEANRINCSQVSADILREQSADEAFSIRCRGAIEIKGKDKMTCYWVDEASVKATVDRIRQNHALRFAQKLHYEKEKEGTTQQTMPGQSEDNASKMIENSDEKMAK